MRPLPPSRRAPARAGLTPADVLVALAVAIVVLLFVLMALPRSRETARLAACRRNLAQIGQGILAYSSTTGELPPVGVPIPVDRPIDEAPPSPHRAMLERLGVADFLGVDALKKEPRPSRASVPEGGVIAGFLCPSDASAFGRFDAPISYRACVGSDFAGADGPFAPGRPMTIHEVERRDGMAFTAAFAERLLGDGRDAASPANYAYADAPIQTGESPGDGPWGGDAGADWTHADFRFTLYTHATAPMAVASVVARDGRSSSMGASSAHVAGVNVLMLDGSARVVAATIDPGVWRAMASIGPEPSDAPRTQEPSP